MELILVAAAGLVGVIALRWLKGRSRPGASTPSTTAALRLGVLSRSMLGDVPISTPDGVVGAVMDWNVSGTLATLIAIADGTVSLYVSPGGGTIGAGAHAPVAAAANSFLEQSRVAESLLHAAQDFPPPTSNAATFYLLYRDRTLASAAVPVSELQVATHPLMRVGAAAQALLTEVRKVSK